MIRSHANKTTGLESVKSPLHIWNSLTFRANVDSLLSPSRHEISLDISSFLEEISSLSHSIVFLYFFALITEEGFLISPCYSLEFYIQIGISLLFFFAFCFSFFFPTAICKPSSDNHFTFLHFFLLGMILIPVSCTMSRTSFHSSSGTLLDLGPQIYFSNLFL